MSSCLGSAPRSSCVHLDPACTAASSAPSAFKLSAPAYTAPTAAKSPPRANGCAARSLGTEPLQRFIGGNSDSGALDPHLSPEPLA